MRSKVQDVIDCFVGHVLIICIIALVNCIVVANYHDVAFYTYMVIIVFLYAQVRE